MNDAAQEVYRAHPTRGTGTPTSCLLRPGLSLWTRRAAPAIGWSQAPLAVAVLLWGGNFFCGCRHLTFMISNLYANMGLLRVEGGEHSLAGVHPQMIAAASQGIRNDSRPAIAYYEHVRGAMDRASRDTLRRLLHGTPILALTRQDVDAAADVWRGLTPHQRDALGDRDILIAGTALARGWALLTRKRQHFAATGVQLHADG